MSGQSTTIIQDKLSQPPHTFIKHLAIGGGGWRVLYMKGVIDALIKNNILPNIECVSATSGGCLAGLTLAVNYNAAESMQFLEDYILNGKFQIPLPFIHQHLNSISPYYSVDNRSGFSETAIKRIANMGIYSMLFAKNMVDAIRSSGLYHTKGLANLLFKIIQNSPTLPDNLKKKNLTFLELHEFQQANKKNFSDRPSVDLFVVVTEDSPDGPKEKYYSYLDTPHEAIITACCASMALPKIYRKVGSNRNLSDGGIVSVVPRKVFDRPPFMHPSQAPTDMNLQLLAICFADSEDAIREWRDNRPNPKQPSKLNQLINNFFWDDKLWKAQVKEHQTGANPLRTLFINCEKVPTLSVDSLSTNNFLTMCREVETQTYQHLEKMQASLINNASYFKKKQPDGETNAFHPATHSGIRVSRL